MVADKDLLPLPGLIKYNILSGGLRPRLLSFCPSGARPAHSATEFRDRYWLGSGRPYAIQRHAARWTLFLFQANIGREVPVRSPGRELRAHIAAQPLAIQEQSIADGVRMRTGVAGWDRAEARAGQKVVLKPGPVEQRFHLAADFDVHVTVALDGHNNGSHFLVRPDFSLPLADQLRDGLEGRRAATRRMKAAQKRRTPKPDS